MRVVGTRYSRCKEGDFDFKTLKDFYGTNEGKTENINTGFALTSISDKYGQFLFETHSCNYTFGHKT